MLADKSHNYQRENGLDINWNLFLKRCHKFYSKTMMDVKFKICIEINIERISSNKDILIITYINENLIKKRGKIDYRNSPLDKKYDLRIDSTSNDPGSLLKLNSKALIPHILEYFNNLSYCRLKNNLISYRNDINSENFKEKINKLSDLQKRFEKWFRDEKKITPAAYVPLFCGLI